MVAPIGDYSYLYGAASRWNTCKHDFFFRDVQSYIRVFDMIPHTHRYIFCYSSYSDHCQQWTWSSLNDQLSIKNITQPLINHHLTINLIVMTQPFNNHHSTIKQWLSNHSSSLSTNLCRSLSPPARWCCDASHRVHRHRNGCRLVHHLIDGWWWKIELVGGWQWFFNGFIMVVKRFMNGWWWFVMSS